MEKLLLHICCAPCAVACVKQLREEGLEPTGFWYNPNIHPYMEYRTRRDTLIEYAKSIGLALTVQDEYGLKRFTKAVCHDIENRCAFCYAVRLEETARYAAEQGYTAIATTLTVSPYQNKELIFEIGQKAAESHHIKFLPYDFSPRYREGQAEARETGMYMQKYCGCIYSEEDRYEKKILQDQKKFKKL